MHPAPLTSRPLAVSRAAVIVGLTVLLLGVGLGVRMGTAGAVPQSEAVFAVHCDLSHSAKDDPIVFPRQPGKAHLHDFFGNTTTDAFSTTRSLTAVPGNCRNGMGEHDRSAYWIPVLLRDGKPFRGTSRQYKVTAYYTVGNKQRAEPVRPFPLGLRVIAGDAKATSPQPVQDLHFGCHRVGERSGTTIMESATIPKCPRTHFLTGLIKFPNCWDGTHLDSSDHQSHMTYPRAERCPASHPVQVPQLKLRVKWEHAVGINPRRLALSNGGQLGLHADFWNGWSPRALSSLVSRCLRGTRRCMPTRPDGLGKPAFPAVSEPAVPAAPSGGDGGGHAGHGSDHGAGHGAHGVTHVIELVDLRELLAAIFRVLRVL